MFRLDIEDVFAKSWERWKSALGELILYSLAYLFGIFLLVFFILLAVLLFLIPLIAVSAGADLEKIKSFQDFMESFGGILPAFTIGLIVLLLVIVFVLVAWEAGWRVAMLKILKGEKPTFADLFSQFPKTLHLFLASLCIGFIVAFGIFMLLIPGIIFGILFSQTIYLIIEKDRDFLSAMGESWNRVSRDFWQITGILILLNMAQVGIGLMASVLNIFTFVPIGSLVVALLVLPYFMLARWVLYFALFPRQEPEPILSVESVESYAVPPPHSVADEFSKEGALRSQSAGDEERGSGASPVPSESAQGEPTTAIATEEGDISLDPKASHDKNEENLNPPN